MTFDGDSFIEDFGGRENHPTEDFGELQDVAYGRDMEDEDFWLAHDFMEKFVHTVVAWLEKNILYADKDLVDLAEDHFNTLNDRDLALFHFGLLVMMMGVEKKKIRMPFDNGSDILMHWHMLTHTIAARRQQPATSGWTEEWWKQ